MTRKEADAFVAKWRPILCPEWQVRLCDGPSPFWAADEHLAATNVSGGGDYLRATIHLHEVVDGELPEADQRRMLLHELLHLTLNDLELAAKEPCKGLSSDARRLGEETIMRFVERTVDRLSIAFDSAP